MTKPRGCSLVIGSGARRRAQSGTLAIREPIQEIEHRLDKVEKRCACLTRDPIFMLAVPRAGRVAQKQQLSSIQGCENRQYRSSAPQIVPQEAPDSRTVNFRGSARQLDVFTRAPGRGARA